MPLSSPRPTCCAHHDVQKFDGIDGAMHSGTVILNMHATDAIRVFGHAQAQTFEAENDARFGGGIEWLAHRSVEGKLRRVQRVHDEGRRILSYGRTAEASQLRLVGQTWHSSAAVRRRSAMR